MATDDDRPHAVVGPRAVLDPERLFDYADWCRRMARSWTELASDRPPERAARLRICASAALFAAWRADEMLRLLLQ